jgi:hypothetical protein
LDSYLCHDWREKEKMGREIFVFTMYTHLSLPMEDMANATTNRCSPVLTSSLSTQLSLPYEPHNGALPLVHTIREGNRMTRSPSALEESPPNHKVVFLAFKSVMLRHYTTWCSTFQKECSNRNLEMVTCPGFRFFDCLGGGIFCGRKFFLVPGFNRSESGLSLIMSLCIGYGFRF